MGYFFDTYALVAIIKNNSNYVKYIDDKVTITIFNLVELYYIVLKDFNEEKAVLIYKKFKDCVNDLDDDIIYAAMKLKLKHKNLSYSDCIGYCFALKNNLNFLTGDKEFKDLSNVEYVK